jgi:uncharacterized membrane protein required for colicin V production
MIPIEFLWLTLIAVFGIIGMVRGLWKEWGTTAVLLLSLFTLHTVAQLIVDRLSGALGGRLPSSAPEGTVPAIYYGLTTIFVAFISYQGIVLEFPLKRHAGPLKWILGFFGGLLNGYLIIGTIWNVTAKASYFGLGTVSSSLTPLHQRIVSYLPVSLMDAHTIVPYGFLAVGMILLLAIVLK